MKRLILILTVLIALVAMSGCDLLTQTTDENSGDGNEADGGGDEADGGGDEANAEGDVTIRIDLTELTDQGTDIGSVQAEITNSSGSAFTRSLTVNESESSASGLFEGVSQGEWSVTITVYDASNSVIGTGTAVLNVSAGENQTVSVDLEPGTGSDSSETGSVELVVVWAPTGSLDLDVTWEEPAGGSSFLWEAGDGLSSWTLGGNNDGTGSVTIDNLGRLRFQVDFDAARHVTTPELDLRNRTVDIRFTVINGSGYSAMGILRLNSDTSYSVGNSFVGSYLIERDTTYYLRTEFDAAGNYTRRLSTSAFGNSDVRLYTGSTSADGLTNRSVRIGMNNSHNASTTLRVDYVEVR
mgnify:CR=1 FL=1